MQAINHIPTPPHIGLFDNVPMDYMNFGHGNSFRPKEVQNWLSLNKDDISRIASVAPSSVRFDRHIPKSVQVRMEEIANIINMVASNFDGNVDRTVAWFKAKNPLLGDVSPRDMIRLGRYERLRKFIVNATVTRRDHATHSPEVQNKTV